MIDTFFEQAYNEEFNKIPAAFRFTKSMRTTFLALIAIWVIIDIFLSGPAVTGTGLTQVIADRGIAVRTDYSSWTLFIIANLILVVILSWGVIGTAFEKKAFRRASKLDRLHKEWVHDRIEKEIRNLRTGGYDYEAEMRKGLSHN